MKLPLDETAENCDQLVKDANDLLQLEQTELAAELFEKVAECFDKKGNRKRSARYLTLAGQLYLKTFKDREAARCYAKAVLRCVLIEDLTTAEFLLEQGKKLGFHDRLFQFRIAEKTLREKKTIADKELKIKTLDVPNDYEHQVIEKLKFVPLQLEEKQQKSLQEVLETIDEVELLEVKGFEIQLESTELPTTELNSLRIVPWTTEQLEKRELKTEEVPQPDVIVENLEPTLKENIEIKTQIKPVVPITSTKTALTSTTSSQEALKPRKPMTTEPYETEVQLPKSVKYEEDVEETLTLSTEKTIFDLDENAIPEPAFKQQLLQHTITEELSREDYEIVTLLQVKDPLLQGKEISVVEKIPLGWQVADINLPPNVKLNTVEVDPTSKQKLLTFKVLLNEDKDELTELAIHLRLRRKILRDVFARKDNQIYKISYYLPFNETTPNLIESEAKFINTFSTILNEVLIEDNIPPDLIVKGFDSTTPQALKVVPQNESILYRWYFQQLIPGQEVEISYKLIGKPITRHYVVEAIHKATGRKIECETWIYPLTTTKGIGIQYLLIFCVETFDPKLQITVTFHLPRSYSVVAQTPIWIRFNDILTPNEHKIVWPVFFDSPEKRKTLLALQIQGDDPFIPIPPELEINEKKVETGFVVSTTQKIEELNLKEQFDAILQEN